MKTAVKNLVHSLWRRMQMRYNIEYRASKFLDKGDLPKAPHFPMDFTYEQVKDTPEFLELMKKDPNLEKFLKEIYIKSYGVNFLSAENDKRLVPGAEEPRPFMIGFYEPEKPLPGHITLTQTFKLLGSHALQPEKWDAKALAKEYNIADEDIGKLLESFKPYYVMDYEPFEKSYMLQMVSMHIPDDITPLETLRLSLEKTRAGVKKIKEQVLLENAEKERLKLAQPKEAEKIEQATVKALNPTEVQKLSEPIEKKKESVKSEG